MSNILDVSAPRLAVEGFDEVLREKVQEGQSILLLGLPFSGKTTLGLQFLVSGLRSGEAGLMITTKDTPETIRAKAGAFGWTLQAYEKRGMLRYIGCCSGPSAGIAQTGAEGARKDGNGQLDKTALKVALLVSEYCSENLKVRLVFDNVSTLLFYNDLCSVARFLHMLLGQLKAVGAMSMVIVESGVQDEQATNAVRSLCDGVLELSCQGQRRYIQGTLSLGSLERLPVRISKNGLRLEKETYEGQSSEHNLL